jgi:hypothetical protein
VSGRNSFPKEYTVAILWRGDAAARKAASPQNDRFYRIFEELAAVGIRAEPAVYDEDFADDVRGQLLAANGVLVWLDPIYQGKTRELLDPLLRALAVNRPVGQRAPRRNLENGRQRGSTPHPAPRLGR